MRSVYACYLRVLRGGFYWIIGDTDYQRGFMLGVIYTSLAVVFWSWVLQPAKEM